MEIWKSPRIFYFSSFFIIALLNIPMGIVTCADLFSAFNDPNATTLLNRSETFYFDREIMVSGAMFDKVQVLRFGLISFELNKTKYHSSVYFNENTYPKSDPMVAAYWAPVSIKYYGEIWIQNTTNSSYLTVVIACGNNIYHQLEKEVNLIDGNFKADWAFIVTWFDVGLFQIPMKRLASSYQIILVADTNNGLTFTILNYNKIGTEHINPRSGFYPGDDIDALFLSQSQEHLLKFSNVNIPGKWIIRIDGQQIPTSCAQSIKAPKLIFNNEVYDSNRNVQVKTGNYTVTCVEENEFGDAENVTLYCGNKRNVSSLNESSLSLDLDISWNNNTCVCHYEYIEGCYNQTTVLVLDVQCHPTTTPKIKVNRGEWLSNRSSISVRVDENIEVTCVIDGDQPTVSNVILQCGNISNTSSVLNVSLNLLIDMSLIGGQCACRTELIDGCYSMASLFSLDVHYGPNDVMAGPQDISISKMCPGDELPEISMYCDVPVDSVNPYANMVIEGVAGTDILPVANSRYLDMYRFNFSFIPIQPGNTTVRCVASNVFHIDFKAEVEKYIIILTPPSSDPVVIFNTKDITVEDGSVQTVTVGEVVEFRCVVEGGLPSVDKTILHCGGYRNESKGTESSLTLSINETKWNGVKCLCNADHTTGCYNRSIEFTLGVLCYPPTAPKMKVNQGEWLLNSSSTSVREDENIEVTCVIDGGQSAVRNVTLQCGSSLNISSGLNASLSLDMNKSWNRKKCVCQAEHLDGCYSMTSLFFLDVHYGPSYVTAGPQVIPSVNICPGEKAPEISMYCDVPVDSVNPYPNMVIEGVAGADVLPVANSRHLDMYRFHFSFTPIQTRVTTIRCVASNVFHIDFKTEVEKYITVFTPPPSDPVVIIKNKNITVEDGSVQTVTVGEVVEFRCVVEGGLPSVDKTILHCGGYRKETKGTESSLTLNIRENGMKCLCKADHKSGCYDRSIQFTLDVLFTLKLAEGQDDLTFFIESGNTVDVSFDVIGRPPPNRYILSTVGESSKLISDDGYAVVYQATDFGRGKVTLSIKGIDRANVNRYLFTMYNGLGEPLDVSFTVVRTSATIQGGSGIVDSLTRAYIILIVIVALVIVLFAVAYHLIVKAKSRRKRRRQIAHSREQQPRHHLTLPRRRSWVTDFL